jgi:uncharacterized membrane protein
VEISASVFPNPRGIHLVTMHSTRCTQGRRGELELELELAILVGLELLVAADIIRTVASESTFQSVGVLALIVVVRTFLS